MAQEKIGFEQFIDAVDMDNKLFVQEMHSYLLENGCKVTFEEKKSGVLASYKHGKPPKAVLNFVFRKQGMLTRIYGERIGEYPDFLNSLPPEMITSIQKAGECKRLTQNGCSPKCSGYDFMIGSEHYQKCRYNCFEFLMTDVSRPFIRAFVERELSERIA
ncbi:MAG: hypothetical protein FWC96_08035 [Oscillospiraceae bacterium]|nr:hypothetical protein [Oscillospiraceae bacterium]